MMNRWKYKTDKSKGFHKQREERYAQKNDPYAFQEYTGESITHPRYFNAWDNQKIFNEPVPLEIQRWLVTPDAMSTLAKYIRLSSVEMLLLGALHKNTLGFLNPTHQTKHKSNRSLKFKSFPFNMISYSYGNYNQKSTREVDGDIKFSKMANNIRARVMRTTVRSLSTSINRSKSAVHRAMKHLQYLKLIQLQSHPVEGTIIAINYYTIEAIFGGKRVAFQNDQPKKLPNLHNEKHQSGSTYTSDIIDFEQMEREGIVEMKNGFITRIKVSIENIVKLQYDNGEISSFPTSHEQFRTMLSRVFPDNVFIRRMFSPEYLGLTT
jgi:hypothetical protein